MTDPALTQAFDHFHHQGKEEKIGDYSGNYQFGDLCFMVMQQRCGDFNNLSGYGLS